MSRWVPMRGGWFDEPEAPDHPYVVLCLAPAGHGPDPFACWPKSIGDAAVLALEFPGDRDPRWWAEHRTFQAQAVDLIGVLATWPCTRFALFGHGSSALVAYEAAVELTRRGALKGLSRLIVSGSPAPDSARVAAPEPDDDELAEQALIRCVEIGGNPLPSLVEMSVRALRTEARALRSYAASTGPRLALPVTVVDWQQDPMADLAGWTDRGPVTFAELNGGPFSYAKAPVELMRVIAADLAVNGV